MCVPSRARPIRWDERPRRRRGRFGRRLGEPPPVQLVVPEPSRRPGAHGPGGKCFGPSRASSSAHTLAAVPGNVATAGRSTGEPVMNRRPRPTVAGHGIHRWDTGRPDSACPPGEGLRANPRRAPGGRAGRCPVRRRLPPGTVDSRAPGGATATRAEMVHSGCFLFDIAATPAFAITAPPCPPPPARREAPWGRSPPRGRQGLPGGPSEALNPHRPRRGRIVWRRQVNGPHPRAEGDAAGNLRETQQLLPSNPPGVKPTPAWRPAPPAD